MKKGTAKRVLALLICVLMAVTMLPTVAMAEEITNNTADGRAIEAYTAYECFLLGKHTVERVCSGLSPLRRDRLWC